MFLLSNNIQKSKVLSLMAAPCFLMNELFTSAAYAADSSHDVEGLPQLDFSTYTSQIFWLGVMFFVLYVFFAKKTLPDISSTVERRKNHIDSDLKTAEELTAKSDNVQTAYKEKLAQAQNDAAAAVKTVEIEARAKVDSYLLSLKERTDSEISDAENNVNKAKAEILNQMDRIVAEASSKAVEKIIGKTSATKKKAA